MSGGAVHITGERGTTARLRLMATSDLHMHIVPYDYVSGTPSLTTGLARTAALIRTAREEVPNALLFDNGDFLYGSPLGDQILRMFAREVHEPRSRHPIIAAMTRLGYDAITLGNHDFDHGMDHLGKVLASAPFPVVSSNLSIMPEGASAGLGPAPVAIPFAMIDREIADEAGKLHPLKIGIIGFLPPGSLNVLQGSRFRAKVRDIAATARMGVPLLRGLGADLVIALAHSGIGAVEDEPGLENAVVPLATVPGIDAIVSGHAHQVFPDPEADWPKEVDGEAGRVHGVPVVAPGFWGSHLGIIDLELGRDPDGAHWTVLGSRCEARPIATRDPETGAVLARVKPDPKILRMLERLHRSTMQKAQESVGATRRRLHSYFAAVAPSPALDVAHRAMLWYAGRRLEGTELAGMPRVASTAPFKAGGLAGPDYFVDIPPGEISLTALADLYLYPNNLVGLRLTGAELGEWLERAASVFNRLEPGSRDRALVVADVPIYGFETLAGVDYEIDLTVPARYAGDGTLLDPEARRIRDVRLNGTPLGAEVEVLLITNSFRATGGGGYPVPGPERVVLDPSVGLRDIVLDYLGATGAYDALPLATWRFAPIGQTEAQFRTSPKACEVLGEVVDRGVRCADSLDEDGFMVCTLTL